MPLLPVSELEKTVPLFRGKVGNAIASSLRKLLSVSYLSDLYDQINQFSGADFAGALIDRLGIDLEIGGADRLLHLPEGSFITVSNHPYGGIDGVILLDLFGHMREGFKVMVNEFLALVEPLRPAWIVVNPNNKDSKGVTAKNIQGVKEVLTNLREGFPVGFFPSGAVSDLKLRDMSIKDREWQESLIRLIMKAKLPIVPVRFFDRNSTFFYLLGLVSWKVRTLRLPHEITNKKGVRIRIGIGDTLNTG
ncbi:MAG: 1-acyl-sn-glycerol-3-phosphate acyltransferase, partial [Bacteroidales bacterium]|nr:1-acyl-sn-glycerol-3-phosphate acyltransferase [Bacteroidales bacterium]